LVIEAALAAAVDARTLWSIMSFIARELVEFIRFCADAREDMRSERIRSAAIELETELR